jgi:uncharacterized membrane protein
MNNRLRAVRIQHYAVQHWLRLFLILYGLFIFLPFLAPVFMHIGWTNAGNAIYDMYSALCHQMAQRSFFLFGDKLMYNADQLPLQLTGHTGPDTLLLRQFRGNDTLGWKVAWSDRMVSMYGGIWLVGVIYALTAHRTTIKPMKWWLAGLFILPLVLDGSTHMISDTFGSLEGGFRYRNEWLATLTGHIFSQSFYAGDAVGSFNSWMRLISGLLFSAGIVGLTFPYLDRASQEAAQSMGNTLTRWEEAERQWRRDRERVLKQG